MSKRRTLDPRTSNEKRTPRGKAPASKPRENTTTPEVNGAAPELAACLAALEQQRELRASLTPELVDKPMTFDPAIAASTALHATELAEARLEHLQQSVRIDAAELEAVRGAALAVLGALSRRTPDTELDGARTALIAEGRQLFGDLRRQALALARGGVPIDVGALPSAMRQPKAALARQLSALAAFYETNEPILTGKTYLPWSTVERARALALPLADAFAPQRAKKVRPLDGPEDDYRRAVALLRISYARLRRVLEFALGAATARELAPALETLAKRTRKSPPKVKQAPEAAPTTGGPAPSVDASSPQPT